MNKSKYYLPSFLEDLISEEDYKKWLDRKASTHYKRDKKRGNNKITRSEYKRAIHNAVLQGGQFDAYTGEMLHWELIRHYDNEKAKKGRKKYKKKFAKLPTVDHVDDGMGEPNFNICSWQINDCKSDLMLSEFLDICKAVLKFHKEDI